MARDRAQRHGSVDALIADLDAFHHGRTRPISALPQMQQNKRLRWLLAGVGALLLSAGAYLFWSLHSVSEVNVPTAAPAPKNPPTQASEEPPKEREKKPAGVITVDDF
jgi:hypothetical protein